MKFFPVVASAVVALSLTGCSDDDSTTTVSPSTTTSAAAQATTAAMETTTSFRRPTSAPGDSTTVASGDSTTSSSGSETTTPSDGGSCSATPSGKYCGKYMMFKGKYCGTAMGMKGSASIDKSTFGLELAPLVDVSNVSYTMEDCTSFLPDFSNPEMVALAKALGMDSEQLSKALKITYDQSNDTFEVNAMSAITLTLSQDQC
ncbi:hypothetical protein FOL47_010505 [Perkinsus chesapeaki]|uniref:Uncharacterized protein n=1 Tax=Perkinsus chesapeaki TaxID=330153 RepID=A0A7J6L2T7_PERCH|nr:hypothetical protein FOL47_010505 [Perkinsus chesapeaki]